MQPKWRTVDEGRNRGASFPLLETLFEASCSVPDSGSISRWLGDRTLESRRPPDHPLSSTVSEPSNLLGSGSHLFLPTSKSRRGAITVVFQNFGGRTKGNIPQNSSQPRVASQQRNRKEVIQDHYRFC